MNQMYKINGNPEQFSDLNVFHKLSQQFLPYAQERLGFDKPVGINLLSDPQNAKNPLGKTAYYDPNKMEVTVFVDKRHVKDILRSMSHELVHHTQNCRGEFEGGVNAGEGYAQKDPHMRKMEEEAYLEGQMLLRDFEDNLKKENKVMAEGKNMVKGPDGKMVPDYAVDGKGPKDEKPANEGKGKLCPKCKKLVCEPHCGGKRDDLQEKDEKEDDKPKGGATVGGHDTSKGMTIGDDGKVRDTGTDDVKLKEGEDPEEESDEEKNVKDKTIAGKLKGMGPNDPPPKNENWTRKNKDTLLFERLVKKWCK